MTVSTECQADMKEFSVFEAPVTNTTNYKTYSWEALCKLTMEDPTVLSNNSHEEKAKNGRYFLRGVTGGPRCDENLLLCHALILDVDKPLHDNPLPTPEEIHAALNELSHFVVSSATPGRCRIVLYVDSYDKAATERLTSAAYQLCLEKGLKFAYAGESKTKSQPWFLPQTTDPDNHQAYCTKDGIRFGPDMVKDLPPIATETKKEKPLEKKTSHNPMADFIDGLQSGTVHEVAKTYIGWRLRTSDLTIEQVFVEVDALIDANCSDDEKVERWHESERESLKEWFKNNVTGDIEEIEEGTTIENLMGEFEVTQQYVDGLGEEEWLYPNLVIACHILVVIAMPGGGKTTFLFNKVVPRMVEKGCKVYYIDADSPSSEHKNMKKSADTIGFSLINPNVNVGTGVEKFIETLKRMAKAKMDLKGTVLIFDTLKKFTNLMSKDAVKEFFILARTLNNMGATCIFAAHANKYRNSDGELIPEGVGDVKNDADDLILFERVANKSGGIDITSVCDPDKGAKVRGLFKPFSFHIDEDRVVTLHEKSLALPDRAQTRSHKSTDEEILAAAEGVLESYGVPLNKTTLLQEVHGMVTAGRTRIEKLLVQHTARKGSALRTRYRFEYTIGQRNSHLISVTGG